MENTKNKVSLKKTFLAGIIQENPVFVSLLGMCPTLATTKSVEAALGMGLLVLLTLMGSNVLISLLRKFIPAEVKIPCYIVIIATFVTIIKLLCQAFVPDLYSNLGVFISLIVVNCIILGRAEAFASKNSVGASFIDGLGTGIGFTMALCIIAFFREVLSTGSLTIGAYFPLGAKYVLPLFPSEYTISLFGLPAGGFLTLGSVLAVMACYKNKKEDKKLALEKARIEELKAKKAAELAAKKAAEAPATAAPAATPVAPQTVATPKPAAPTPAVPNPNVTPEDAEKAPRIREGKSGEDAREVLDDPNANKKEAK